MTKQKTSSHLAVFADQNDFADVQIREESFLQLVDEAAPDVQFIGVEIDNLREDVERLFGMAVGQFQWATYRTKRPELVQGLDDLETGLTRAAEVLVSVGRRRSKMSSDVLNLIATVSFDNSNQMKLNLETALVGLNQALSYVHAAKAELSNLKGEGKPPATWYEPVVQGALLVADKIKVPVTIAGDRQTNPHDTRFVRLVMALENFVPEEMRSNTLAACAKRIERSQTWLKLKDKS